MGKFHLKAITLLTKKNDKSFDFSNEISEKNTIKEIIESYKGVKNTFTEHFQKLNEWWSSGVGKEIEAFPKNNNLWNFRKKALKSLNDKLIPLGLFDEFKIAGVFVNWWEDLKYDFKTIVSSGWSKMLIDDERIAKKFFAEDLEKIEEFESKVAQVEGELNEILEEVEDWDEEEQGQKTSNKVKDYLKQIINDLLSSKQDAAKKEAKKWQDLITRIEEKDKELKKLNRELKQKEENLENRVKQKRETLTEEEAKGLLLEKFKEGIKEQLEKYLNAEKKELIKIFEKLWDKYKISLKELLAERNEEVKKLNKFLKQLGYENE